MLSINHYLNIKKVHKSFQAEFLQLYNLKGTELRYNISVLNSCIETFTKNKNQQLFLTFRKKLKRVRDFYSSAPDQEKFKNLCLRILEFLKGENQHKITEEFAQRISQNSRNSFGSNSSQFGRKKRKKFFSLNKLELMINHVNTFALVELFNTVGILHSEGKYEIDIQMPKNGICGEEILVELLEKVVEEMNLQKEIERESINNPRISIISSNANVRISNNQRISIGNNDNSNRRLQNTGSSNFKPLGILDGLSAYGSTNYSRSSEGGLNKPRQRFNSGHNFSTSNQVENQNLNKDDLYISNYNNSNNQSQINPRTSLPTNYQLNQYQNRIPRQSNIERRFQYKIDDSKITYNPNKISHKSQIEEYRKKAREKSVNSKKINTLSDLRNKDPNDSKLYGEQASFEGEILGRECMKLTNKFRKENGLCELKFDIKIYPVGLVHSKNMALKKLPLGHKGFKDRVKKLPFSHSKSGENVAYASTGDFKTVARIVVDGWIKSPGHRKNLLGDYNTGCVSAYRNKKGVWFFTQLLAYKF